MNLILFLLRQSRSIVLLAALAGAVSGAANALLLALVHDLLTGTDTTPKGVAAAFIALCVGLPLSRIVSETLMAYFAQKAISDLRLHMCRRILAVPLRHLEETGRSRLLASLTDDIGSITNTLLQIPMVCIQSTILTGCILYMGWLSWQATLGLMFFLVVGLLSLKLLVQKASPFLHLAREEQDVLFSHFRAITEGVKELKLHRGRRTAFLDELLEPASVRYRRHNVIARAIYSLAGAWFQLLYFGALGLLLLVFPAMANLDRGALTGFALILLYMITPLDFLTTVIVNFGRSSVALRKVESLGLSLAEQAEDEVRSETREAAGWHSLELAGVTHTYHHEREGSHFALGPIDLSFRAGELVFLTGGNGSGKTTLAKLLTGLYMPEAGEVRLDGVPVTRETRDPYRNLFSAVFSDFFLFESLLGIGRNGLGGRVHEYLLKLELDRKVQVDAERGAFSTLDLSQGQRKRLALLTAYMEDRPIYLFDEWAADQDPDFKKIFYCDLLPELKSRGKTVFVISHDDSYYNLADRVIHLKDGQVRSDSAWSDRAQPLPARDMAAHTLPLTGT